jgi:hypothetical protein
MGRCIIGGMKVTLDVKDDLYRAIKVEAARQDRTVRDIAEEALNAWLEANEDAEDIAAAQEAEAEYARDGGAVEAEEFFRTLAAEVRAKYGSSRA